MSLQNDPEAVEAALRAIIAPGEVFEIRCLHPVKWRGLVGYWNDPAKAAMAVAELEDDYSGVYVTLNPLNPDCLYRSNSRFTKLTKELCATDADVTGRNWLPVDIDPVRVSGISSTDSEHKGALKLATVIASTLELTYGFSDPLFASSGNGAHLLYPVAMPNDHASRDTIKETLRSLDISYTSGYFKVDTSVFNAARIWRLYGTVARKGSNSKERPWRQSAVISECNREPISLKHLRAVQGSRERSSDSARRDASLGATKQSESSYPADEAKWRQLNRKALGSAETLAQWVPDAFGEHAREYLNGYRISSEALARDREEDLSIQPLPIGIVDFGEHDLDDPTNGHRTPVSILAEFLHDSKAEAAKWLADALSEPESEFEGLAGKYASQPREVAESPEDDDIEDGFKATKKFNRSVLKSASSIIDTVYEGREYLVDNLLPRGAYCLISRPKMGKSWLALQLSLAKAKGGSFLGSQVKRGKVIMLSLEEKSMRLQDRIKRLNGGKEPPKADLDNLLVITLDDLIDNQFPRGEAGCRELRQYVEDDPEIDLIIIDTFSLFRDHDSDYGGSVYDRDYASVMPIVRLASELRISVICVHHERKGATVAGKQDADFTEAANGSAGLTAAFEGVIRIEGVRTEEVEDEDLIDETLDEKPHEPTQVRKLKIAGRDIEKDVVTRSMAFDTTQGGWYRTGKIDVEGAIIRAIRHAVGLTWTDIKTLLPQVSKNELKRKLTEMVAENILDKTQFTYTLQYAGDLSDFPAEILHGITGPSEILLTIIQWRGLTPLSFIYALTPNMNAGNTRSYLAGMCNRGDIIRVRHGEYKITKRGAKILADRKKEHGDDADAADLL